MDDPVTTLPPPATMSPDDFAFYSKQLYEIALTLGCPPSECQPGMVLFQRAGNGWILYAGIWASDVVAPGAGDRLSAISALSLLSAV
jgi:hypothetical protein